ncbi:MAG: hypothetical protein HY246_18290 [Proteobacteria bacterium]|nr:hypothetical protein [Pseudomonadota bacterium]
MSKPSRLPETSLYAPVKAFLEEQGYVVKGEIGRCDVLAVRGDEKPVIVELKIRLTLELLLQGVERLALSDAVYLAVPAPRGASPLFDRRFRKLLRRVGLGLLVVHESRAGTAKVEAVLDPLPYRQRIDHRRAGRMLGEFVRREGDPNEGGSTRRVKLVTAYRQEALRVASVLSARGPQKPAMLRIDAEAPHAGRMLLQDVYGWFARVERGVYALTPAGSAGLQAFLGRFALPACLREVATAEIAARLS